MDEPDFADRIRRLFKARCGSFMEGNPLDIEAMAKEMREIYLLGRAASAPRPEGTIERLVINGVNTTVCS